MPRIPLIGGDGKGAVLIPPNEALTHRFAVPPLPMGEGTGVRGEGRGEGEGADVAARLKPRPSSELTGAAAFWAVSRIGTELADLHVNYETLEPYPLQWMENKDVPLSYRVEDKMRLSKDKRSLKVNESLTLAGIPPETFQYHLGNRSALEWSSTSIK